MATKSRHSMILHVFRYDKESKNVAAMQGASVVLWGAVSRLDVAPSLGKVCQHARHVIQAVCEF